MIIILTGETLYFKIRESGADNSELISNMPIKYKIIILRNYLKIKNIFGKYVHVLDFFQMNLVVFSVTIGRIAIAPFISAAGTPVEIRTLFFTMVFTLMTLLNYSLKSWKVKKENIKKWNTG